MDDRPEDYRSNSGGFRALTVIERNGVVSQAEAGAVNTDDERDHKCAVNGYSGNKYMFLPARLAKDNASPDGAKRPGNSPRSIEDASGKAGSTSACMGFPHLILQATTEGNRGYGNSRDL